MQSMLLKLYFISKSVNINKQIKLDKKTIIYYDGFQSLEVCILYVLCVKLCMMVKNATVYL